MNFVDIWTENKNIILSEITEIQKDKIACSFSFDAANSKSLDVCIYFGVNKKIMRRDHHGSHEVMRVVRRSPAV